MSEKAQFHLRISADMLKALKKEAKRERRTITAQMVYAIEYYLGGLGLLPKEKDEK